MQTRKRLVRKTRKNRIGKRVSQRGGGYFNKKQLRRVPTSGNLHKSKPSYNNQQTKRRGQFLNHVASIERSKMTPAQKQFELGELQKYLKQNRIINNNFKKHVLNKRSVLTRLVHFIGSKIHGSSQNKTTNIANRLTTSIKHFQKLKNKESLKANAKHLDSSSNNSS